MSKKKIILSVISANLYLPLLAALFPAGGIADNCLFFAALIHIIYFAATLEKPWHHLLLSLNLALSYCGGVVLSTWIYYNNISDDPMTPVVGGAIVLNAAAILAVVITVSTVFKSIKRALASKITPTE